MVTIKGQGAQGPLVEDKYQKTSDMYPRENDQALCTALTHLFQIVTATSEHNFST